MELAYEHQELGAFYGYVESWVSFLLLQGVGLAGVTGRKSVGALTSRAVWHLGNVACGAVAGVAFGTLRVFKACDAGQLESIAGEGASILCRCAGEDVMWHLGLLLDRVPREQDDHCWSARCHLEWTSLPVQGASDAGSSETSGTWRQSWTWSWSCEPLLG